MALDQYNQCNQSCSDQHEQTCHLVGKRRETRVGEQ